jgi:DNA-binding NarL/FixJ family response regulator
MSAFATEDVPADVIPVALLESVGIDDTVSISRMTGRTVTDTLLNRRRLLDGLGAKTVAQAVDRCFSTGVYAVEQNIPTEKISYSEFELDVIRGIGRGSSDQSIAEELSIAVGTVSGRLNRARKRASVRWHNRSEAVFLAHMCGLIGKDTI